MLATLLGTEPSVRAISTLADMAIKGVLILSVAGVASAMLRRSGAAVRHLVWSLALAGLVALLILSLALPKLQVPILPAWAEPVISLPSPADRARTAPNEPPSAAAAAVETPPIQTGETAVGVAASPHTLPPSAASLSPNPELQASSASTPASVATSASPSLHWTVWVLMVWLVGMVLAAVPFLAGTLIAWWRCRRATQVDEGRWLTLLSNLKESLSIRRPVALLRSSSSDIPFTWGVRRPVIMLPAESDDWSDERCRAVLLHELAHVKRVDCLTQFVAHLALVIHWFNPLAWLAGRIVRIERERACDDLVLSAGMKPSDYASHLLDIVRTLRSSRCPSLASVAMARKSQFEGRMRAILDPGRRRGRLTRLGIALTILSVVGVVLPISVLQAIRAADGGGAVADVGWSKEDNGLECRLFMDAPLAAKNGPHKAVIFEVRNVSGKKLLLPTWAHDKHFLGVDVAVTGQGDLKSPTLHDANGGYVELEPGKSFRMNLADDYALATGKLDGVWLRPFDPAGKEYAISVCFLNDDPTIAIVDKEVPCWTGRVQSQAVRVVLPPEVAATHPQTRPAPPAGPINSEWSKPLNGVALKLETAKPQYKVGDRIVLDFVFKNVSDKKMRIYVQQTPEGPRNCSLALSDLQGKALGGYWEPAKEPQDKLLDVEAGKELRISVPLDREKIASPSHFYRPVGQEPLAFAVSGLYRMPLGADFKQDVWSGSLTAGPIQITIDDPRQPTTAPGAFRWPEALGQSKALADIQAGKSRILHYGLAWPQGKPLVEPATNLPVEELRDGIFTKEFVDEISAYNRTIRAWGKSRNPSATAPATRAGLTDAEAIEKLVAVLAGQMPKDWELVTNEHGKTAPTHWQEGTGQVISWRMKGDAPVEAKLNQGGDWTVWIMDAGYAPKQWLYADMTPPPMQTGPAQECGLWRGRRVFVFGYGDTKALKGVDLAGALAATDAAATQEASATLGNKGALTLGTSGAVIVKGDKTVGGAVGVLAGKMEPAKVADWYAAGKADAAGDLPVLIVATRWVNRPADTFQIGAVERDGDTLRVTVRSMMNVEVPVTDQAGVVYYSYAELPDLLAGSYKLDVTYQHGQRTKNGKESWDGNNPGWYPAGVTGQWTVTRKDQKAPTATQPAGTGAWSEPVNGLRARLVVENPVLETETVGFFRVNLELQNQGDSALSIVSGNPFSMDCTIQDRDGKDINPTMRRKDVAYSPKWKDLARGESIRIAVAQETALNFKTAPGKPIGILDATTSIWQLPTGQYRVAVRYSSKDWKHDQIANPWSGELKVPAVDLEVRLKSATASAATSPATSPAAATQAGGLPGGAKELLEAKLFQPTVAVLEAAEDGAEEARGGGSRAVSAQRFKVIDVLSGERLDESVRVTYLCLMGERPAAAGERAVWIIGDPTYEGQRPVYVAAGALADTEAGRKAATADRKAEKKLGEMTPMFLPRSRVAIDEAMNGPSVVMVCEALEARAGFEDEIGVEGGQQKFKVLEVLRGGGGAAGGAVEAPKVGAEIPLSYIRFRLALEAAIGKGEKVVWVARPLGSGHWRGYKVLADTVANRKLLVDWRPRPEAVVTPLAEDLRKGFPELLGRAFTQAWNRGLKAPAGVTRASFVAKAWRDCEKSCPGLFVTTAEDEAKFIKGTFYDDAAGVERVKNAITELGKVRTPMPWFVGEVVQSVGDRTGMTGVELEVTARLLEGFAVPAYQLRVGTPSPPAPPPASPPPNQISFKDDGGGVAEEWRGGEGTQNGKGE